MAPKPEAPSSKNTQLSIKVDSGARRTLAGGVFNIALEARNGSSSSQDTFCGGLYRASVHRAGLPGSFLRPEVLPTDYFVFQSLTPKFSVILGKFKVLTHVDQTFLGNSYK